MNERERYLPEGYRLNTPENDEYTKDLAALTAAMHENRILEGRALLCDKCHDLTVSLGESGLCGVIPREEALYLQPGETEREIAVITRVGKAVCFRITSIDVNEGTPIIRLSRREAQKECYERFLLSLLPGDVIDSRITHEEPFGCFCDVGCGLISLLPIDGISVSRISHPKERFYTGEYIRAVVRRSAKIDGRVSLSCRELLGTWEENASLFHPGETVTGIVRGVEPYGIFVELTPNLAGLAEWREGVRAGQTAAVYIKSILPEKMKIKLVIVNNDACENGRRPQSSICLRELLQKNTEHISYWRYSPEGCDKLVETRFDEEE